MVIYGKRMSMEIDHLCGNTNSGIRWTDKAWAFIAIRKKM